MRFYNRQHRHYCGIDLHVKTMYAREHFADPSVRKSVAVDLALIAQCDGLIN